MARGSVAVSLSSLTPQPSGLKIKVSHSWCQGLFMFFWIMYLWMRNQRHSLSVMSPAVIKILDSRPC